MPRRHVVSDDDSHHAAPPFPERSSPPRPMHSQIHAREQEERAMQMGMIPRHMIAAPTTFVGVEDITFRIASFLEPRERAVFASANRQFRHVAYDKRLIAAAEDVFEAELELKELQGSTTGGNGAPHALVVLLFAILAGAAALFSLCGLADTGALPNGSIAGIVMVCLTIGIGGVVTIGVAINVGRSFSNFCLAFSLFVVVLPLAILSNFYLATYRYVSEPPFVPECSQPVHGTNYPFTVRFADPTGWSITSSSKRYLSYSSSSSLYRFSAYRAMYTISSSTNAACQSNDVGSGERAVLILNHPISSLKANHDYPSVLWSVYFAEALEDAVSRSYTYYYWSSNSYVPLIMPMESPPSMSSKSALTAFAVCFVLIWAYIIAAPLFLSRGAIRQRLSKERIAELKDVVQGAEAAREDLRQEMAAVQKRLDQKMWR